VILFEASLSVEQSWSADPGSFNEVIEMAPTPVGQIIVPPGESGFIPFPIPASPPQHLRDQLPLYESFSYRPMPFAPGDLEGPTTTETLPLARPPRASSFLRRGAVGYGDERGSRPGVRKGGLEPDGPPQKSSVFKERDRQGPSPTVTNCAGPAQSRRRR
jgi:hypothetical protein